MFVNFMIFIDRYFLLTAIYEHYLEPSYEHKLVKQVGLSEKKIPFRVMQKIKLKCSIQQFMVRLHENMFNLF
jgi:hypothetical protein